MASKLRKSAPILRNPSRIQAHSHNAGPSNPHNAGNRNPSMNTERLQPASSDSRDTSDPALKTTEYQPIKDNKNETLSPWGIHWTSPALMLFLFTLGVGASIGHHFYYQSLHGTIASSENSQEWAIRIGTGLAFVVKASLAAAIGVAYTQRLWLTLRRKSFTMAATDDLFQLTFNPLSFFGSEVWAHASLLCLMAASMWLLPLVATITPATLSIVPGMAINTTNLIVPTLNFNSSTPSSYYDSGVAYSRRRLHPRQIEYITAPSIELSKALTRTATAGRVTPLTGKYPDFTYDLQFFGPSLKCHNMSNPDEDFEENEDVPMLQDMFRYFAASNLSALSYGPSGNPMDQSPTFFGYAGSNLALQLAMDRHLPAAGPVREGMNTALLGTFFIITEAAIDGDRYNTAGYNVTCNLWNTSYSLNVGYGSGEQSTVIRELRRLEPKHLQTKSGHGVAGTKMEDLAYAAYGMALFDLLETYIDTTRTGIMGIGSQLLRTSLGTCPELSNIISEETAHSEAYMCRNGTVFRAIEDLSLNLTLSLMATPSLSSNTTVAATVTSSVNRYSYNWQNLSLAYGIGILVALAGISIGCFSYITNGYSASMSFSSIMFTTRNPDLDALFEGRCLPALPLGEKLGAVPLRYGMLRSEEKGEVEHAAFGYSSTIRELKKGTKCA